MSVDLNQEVCAFCGTRLTDRTSVVEDEGELYCCGNCFAAASDPSSVGAMPNPVRCSHCGVVITDRKSTVQRGLHNYCCNNCANAPQRENVGRPA